MNILSGRILHYYYGYLQIFYFLLFQNFGDFVNVLNCHFENIVNTVSIQKLWLFAENVDSSQDIGISNDAQRQVILTNVQIEYFDKDVTNDGTLDKIGDY